MHSKHILKFSVIHEVCIGEFNQLHTGNVCWGRGGIPESFKNQNCQTNNYVHSIYILLGIVGNPEMIYSTGGYTKVICKVYSFI